MSRRFSACAALAMMMFALELADFLAVFDGPPRLPRSEKYFFNVFVMDSAKASAVPTLA